MVDRRQTGWRKPRDYEGDPLTDEEIEKFEYMSVKPFETCVGCDEHWIDLVRESEYAVDDGTYSSKKEGYICYGCRESDDYHPSGTVIIYDPQMGTATKWVIGDYNDMCWVGPEGLTSEELELEAAEFYPEDDGEQSPIQFTYVRTGGWRGYHTPVKPDGWIQVHSDCILAMSKDEMELKSFDEEAKRALWDLGIKFAVVFGSTSNLFSTGYDILAETSEDELSNMAMVMKLNQLRIQYRDPDRFHRTALTGHDPDDPEERRRADLLVKASRMLRSGKDFEEVKEEILAEARA